MVGLRSGTATMPFLGQNRLPSCIKTQPSKLASLKQTIGMK